MATLSGKNTLQDKTTEFAGGDIMRLGATINDARRIVALKIEMVERGSHYWDTYTLNLDDEEIVRLLSYALQCDPSLKELLK